KLREITQAEAQREREREEKAAQRFTVVERDRLLWEKEHGNGRDSETLAGRRTSDGKLLSVDLETGLSTPDLKAAPPAFVPTLDFGSKATAADLSSGVVQNEDDAADAALAEKDPEIREKLKLLDEIRRVKQNIEALRENPAGGGAHAPPSPTQTVYTGLLGTGADGSSSGHHRSRTNSRPLSTASMPVDTAIAEAHAVEAAAAVASPTRPPRAAKPNPRNRTRSDGSYVRFNSSSTDEDPLNLSKTLKVPEDPAKMHWDQYTRDRSLFTPPAGVTAPIPTTTTTAPDYVVPVSPAVQEALERRMAREAAVESGEVWTGSGLGMGSGPAGTTGRAASPRLEGGGRHPVAFPKEQRYPQGSGVRSPRAEEAGNQQHMRQASGTSSANVIVVPNPPKRKTSNNGPSSPASPITPPPRVVTAGELDERHRQRMRALQRPITEREAEQAKLDDAKARWENSRRIERAVMERKEKEQRRSSNEGQQQQQQQAGVEEEGVPRRSWGGAGASGKVAEWQKRQSIPPPPRRKSTAREREGSMEVGGEAQLPPTMPAARNEKRFSSRSLDTWNMFSSPGSAMKPAPN
ncbi:hypothetical protein FRB90_008694, partial [Tulasnella sp. 427]